MRKLLVCAATQMELQTFTPAFSSSGQWVFSSCAKTDSAFGVVTGVGIPFTLAELPGIIANTAPDYILNIGIAGAYPNSGLKIGDVVLGSSEVFGDIGFELPESPGFQPLTSSAFGAPYANPFLLETSGWDSPILPFSLGAGCTVNCCTGTDKVGIMREKLYGVQFESMEGAAVAMIGQREDIPVMEIRSISNIAGNRDMRPENIRLALDQLIKFFAQASFRKQEIE